MHTAQPRPAPDRAPGPTGDGGGSRGRRLLWLYAITGVVLLVVAVVMMTCGAG